MRSRGRQKAARVAWGRRVARGLRRNSVLLALAALALLVAGALLFAQHSNTGTTGLALQVDPADLLTIQGGTTVSLKIRLGTGPAYLWGDSLSDCNSPIGSATTISTSGIYTPLLSAVPFNQTSNDYVCVYSPSTSSLNTSVAWPHTGLSLAFNQQPSNTASGASISPAVTVQVKDSNGILVASSTASVTIGITSGTGTSGATLSGTLTHSAVNGVATFNNLSIDKAGTNYQLHATSGSLTAADSATFNITTGAVDHFAISAISSPQTAGTAFNITTITAQDANNNTVTGFTSTVTFGGTAGVTGTSPGFTAGVLSNASVTPTVAGSNLTVTVNDGSGHTGSATIATVNPAGINHFAISAISSPQTAGTAFNITTITAQDVNNNTVTGFTSTVTFVGTAGVTGTSPGFTAGVLSNASVTPTVAGSNLTVTVNDGSGHTGSATIATVNAGPAAKLAFTTQPGGGTGGTAWTTQPVVTVQDAGGNTVTSSSASITLAIGTNPGGGTLTCTTNPQNASAGVDTFAGCNINKAGTGYTLTATSSGLTSATSSAFNITAGTATKVVFTTQPGGGTGGTAWTTQPIVTVEDANGNTVTGSSASIMLAIGTNPGGGTLTCTTNPQSASSGVDTFAGCNINKAGTGYTLTATSSGLTSATSSTFNITVGSAAQLAFTTQPGGGTGGTAWTTQPVVTVQDAGGNTVTSSSASITLAIGTNPGGGTLTCTGGLSKSASSGVATFAGCRINNTGNGYTLTATSSGLTSATSNTFNITGAATKVVFTTQPGGGTGGTPWTTQPVVTVEDTNGNTVTGSSASITLAIRTNPGGGTLTCTTNPQNASYGVDTFAGCKINTVGTGYTLRATSTGLTSATSNTFNITVGSAAQLAFTRQPGGGTGGTAWTTQPVVTVQDAGGNTVTGSSASVTLAIGTNPGGGTLTCTTNPQSASSGVDTFAGCKIDKAGNGYTLMAASSGLTSATSNTFNITVGAAAQLAFTTSPSNSTHGVAFPTQPVVTLQDAGGNTVTGRAQNVTLAIQNNPGGGTLSGTKTVAVNTSTGQATFTGLSINNAGTGYTLTATGSTVDTTAGVVVSSAFNIT